MTIQMDEASVMAAIEVAAIVGSIVSVLVIGLIVYLLVRPSRRQREARRAEPDAIDVEEMIQLIDRMEQRLEVLERAVETREDQPLLQRAKAHQGGE